LNEPYWDAPWGKGRPGWHIECSVLASLIFGNNLDFHGGGLDLRFPHHENEEAQCCGHHNVDQWVNYWIHTGQLHLAGEAVKMSKSLKNTVTISELLAKYTADEFRMLCLTSHYRYQVDFSDSNMERARSICKKIYSFHNDVDACVKGQKMFTPFNSIEVTDQMCKASNSIEKLLRDDFNTNACIEDLMKLIGTVNKLINRYDGTLQQNSPSNIMDLLAVNNFIRSKLDMFGLNLNNASEVSEKNSVNVDNIVNSVVDIRNKLRKSASKAKINNC